MNSLKAKTRPMSQSRLNSQHLIQHLEHNTHIHIYTYTHTMGGWMDETDSTQTLEVQMRAYND